MTRHASLADQLRERLKALRRHVTEPDHVPEPIETNWSTVPANDNNAEDLEGMHVERAWRIRPSEKEIMKAIKEGEIIKNDAGQTVAIGTLQFSDGTQTEAGYKLVMGKPVRARIRLPAGAMLYTKDAEEHQIGAEEDGQHVEASNAYFAGLFGLEPRPYKVGGKRKGGENFTHAKAKEMLADAYARTDMAAVNIEYCPDGLPNGTPKIAENFVGMQKTTVGESGSIMWQDIVTARADRKEWFDAVDSLSGKDRTVLDAAKGAKTYADVGRAIGQSLNYARHNGGGKRAIIAANDNLMMAANKYASGSS